MTAADHEHLARQAVPSVARIRCLPAGNGTEPGAVRVLVVPDAVADEGDRLRFEQLVPSDVAARHDHRAVGRSAA